MTQPANAVFNANISNTSSGVSENMSTFALGASERETSDSSLQGSGDSDAAAVARKGSFWSVGARRQSAIAKSSKSSSSGSNSSSGKGLGGIWKSKKGEKTKQKAKPKDLNWLRDTLSLNSSAHSSMIQSGSSQDETKGGKKPANSSSTAFRRGREGMLGSPRDGCIQTEADSPAFTWITSNIPGPFSSASSGMDNSVYNLADLQREYARKCSLEDNIRRGNEKMAGEKAESFPGRSQTMTGGPSALPNDPSQAAHGRNAETNHTFSRVPDRQQGAPPRQRASYPRSGEHQYPETSVQIFNGPRSPDPRRHDCEGRGLEHQGVPRSIPPRPLGSVDDLHHLRRYEDGYGCYSSRKEPVLQSNDRKKHSPHPSFKKDPHPRYVEELRPPPSCMSAPFWSEYRAPPRDPDGDLYRVRQQTAPPSDRSLYHDRGHSQDRYFDDHSRHSSHHDVFPSRHHHDDERHPYPLPNDCNAFDDPAFDSRYVGRENFHCDGHHHDSSRRKHKEDDYDDRDGSSYKQDFKGQVDQVRPKEANNGALHAEKPLLVEISPGCVVPLRRTGEILDAVAMDFFRPMTCICCSQDMFCIPDIQFVVCPHCRTIGPVEGDNCFEGCEIKGEGLGLGFTAETLYKMQQELLQKRHAHA